jgi:hypothetical protein
MPPLTLSPMNTEPTMPSDPLLRAVVDDVISQIRYSFAVAASGDGSPAPGDLDQMFSRFLATRSPAQRARHKATAKAMLNAAPVQRASHFARYATVDPQKYRAIGSDGVRKIVSPMTMDGQLLSTSLSTLGSSLVAGHPLIKIKLPKQPTQSHPPGKLHLDPDLIEGLAFKKMKLFITRVRCVEETNELGSDEIAMGGTLTDARGNTSPVGEFQVSSDFDQGEVVEFGMSKPFATWDLQTAPVGFPYVYSAVLAMGEKDDGGFWKLLKELWEKVKTIVVTAIGALAGAAIGAAIGAAFAGLGAVIGAVVGALLGWLIGMFDNADDVVGVKTVTMSLGAATKSYYNWAKLTTPQGLTGTLHFKGDGGRYDVDIAYRAFTQ